MASDTDDSDLDILIDPTTETTLFDIGAIRHELLQLLGVPVDVLTLKALPGNSGRRFWQKQSRYETSNDWLFELYLHAKTARDLLEEGSQTQAG